MRNINTIIIHCSDTDTGTIEGIRNYHIKTKGWKDIGYHYVIERSGTVKDGRPLDQSGAHCEGHNAASIGICLVGKVSFVPEQLKALEALIVRLEGQFPGITQVKGHREFDTAIKQGKTCPSDAVMRYLVDKGLHKG